jgi:hypothetical protein
LRRAFDVVEAQIGPRLQQGVGHERFADAVTGVKRAQRGAGRRVESVTTAVLHLFNIPAQRDLRRATAQLTRIERELRKLSDEQHHPRPGSPREDS